MESIRWLLAVAGVEFEEVAISKRQEYVKLLSGRWSTQVPLVEMDGMKLVQTQGYPELHSREIQSLWERLKRTRLTCMLRDLMEMIMVLAFLPPDAKKTKLEEIERKATSRYLPVFEKALPSSQYLVGNQLSCADVQLLETTLMLEEKFPTILSKFPVVKGG
ncbi:unnamed protein product [Coregonus sp. 'balchen']|nr:unnamed protein product [Coregonus sp. 'balchen']